MSGLNLLLKVVLCIYQDFGEMFVITLQRLIWGFCPPATQPKAFLSY